MIGIIQSVDTGNVTIKVSEESVLNNIQVNQLVWIRSTKTNEKIIGLVSKILRRALLDSLDDEGDPGVAVENMVKVELVGTFVEKEGTNKGRFKRTINTVPSVNADANLMEGDELTAFMNAISTDNENPLSIGRYVISHDSQANLDGNKFFQRHAIIVGGTGSGKSCTVANLLEKASKLKSVDALVFDLHGEYSPLSALGNAKLFKIAGPSDTPDDSTSVFLPYWLLSYEEVESMLLDRRDVNAPNQARILLDLRLEGKQQCLAAHSKESEFPDITVESPLPYDIRALLLELHKKDVEMVPGVRGEKQGPLNGKLTRFIQRLESKISDKRLNFIFNSSSQLQKHDWFEGLARVLMGFGGGGGLKIIDFSEVPSDILPLITGLVARLVFSLQQWMNSEKRHPIALFCDEAHLYIPSSYSDSVEESGLRNFERIAKEGRKYGLSLVVISQRPADVNKTVLSQCGNFIAMRLSNPDDQSVIKRLFPDNMGGFADSLPILDVGEAIIVGDACLLPSRIKIDLPGVMPKSATVDFWTEWGKEKAQDGIMEAVKALRKQSR